MLEGVLGKNRREQLQKIGRGLTEKNLRVTPTPTSEIPTFFVLAGDGTDTTPEIIVGEKTLKDLKLEGDGVGVVDKSTIPLLLTLKII